VSEVTILKCVLDEQIGFRRGRLVLIVRVSRKTHYREKRDLNLATELHFVG
jgi:hypothetical protein